MNNPRNDTIWVLLLLSIVPKVNLVLSVWFTYSIFVGLWE